MKTRKQIPTIPNPRIYHLYLAGCPLLLVLVAASGALDFPLLLPISALDFLLLLPLHLYGPRHAN